MRHEEKFTQSHQPYAVDLSSLSVSAPSQDHGHVWVRVRAVWFRRRRSGWGGSGDMRTVACLGELRELVLPPVGDARSFLEKFTDGRYGGDCQARWDGTELWSAPMSETTRQRHLAVLRTVLENHPAVPEGYDGWWTFRG
jgi:hypothetical protein